MVVLLRDDRFSQGGLLERRFGLTCLSGCRRHLLLQNQPPVWVLSFSSGHAAGRSIWQWLASSKRTKPRTSPSLCFTNSFSFSSVWESSFGHGKAREISIARRARCRAGRKTG